MTQTNDSKQKRQFQTSIKNETKENETKRNEND